ncbi:TonB-dependent siderophore receptor [Treponema sp. C6A8]|uniref:TonB-dependent receptor plug domain-containing protein n=1 Tax=Treponema sp. C6A8 TaxID=1410609 RepID=UPI000487C155|nr:TonB-dependent receptor [Treponema sp. C6A8]
MKKLLLLLLFLPAFAFAGETNLSEEDDDLDFTLEDEMELLSVIEGEGLEIHRSAPERAGEKTGVSTVITKEEMKATANMGIAEDTMAAVRTLPGVTYGGAWGSEPSVRGGQPRELGYTLDGMYLLFPYHWGGGASFFYPSIIDSIKLSNGVFSAKYGRASSGLMEATTLKPDFEKVHVNAGISTTCADAFVQVPFGKNVGGMIIGSHLSYLDPIVWVFKQMNIDGMKDIDRAPYIRDLFLKANFKPCSELDISVIGFFGSDGLSLDTSVEKNGLTTKTVMDYDIYQVLGGVNIKYLATDKLMFHGLFSYNGMFENLDMKEKESGIVKYNNDFIKKYSSKSASVKSGAGYNLDGFGVDYTEDIKNHLVTGCLESEIELNEKNHLCVGFDETFQKGKNKNSIDGWDEQKVNDDYIFRRVKKDISNDGNCIFDNAAFISWTYGNDTDFIQTELGLRGEFINLRNFDDDYSISLVPDICPRANITFTPWRNKGILEKASFTAGTGLFVSIPRETMMFNRDMGLKDFEMHPNRALLGVLGADAALEGGWKFKVETYYKYYLSRIYNYQFTSAESGYKDIDILVKTNGKGYVFGVDTMIEKKIGSNWDGYLSYSFVYSKLKNPVDVGANQVPRVQPNEPLNEWYFPAYHRFHTMNLVSNWHFGKGWTFTVKGTLATGTPKEDTGDVFCYAAVMDDGTVVQRYTRSSVYSDTLRTTISCPVDLKISREWKTNGGKTSWEYYFALQDVFVNLYQPRGNKEFNSFTGEMDSEAKSASFNLGMPVPSFGLKVKF